MLAALALGAIATSVTRDAYGVPMVRAATPAAAWRAAGFAVAQDRMWQMELSRRQARGRLAEILGTDAVASDREVLLTSYTDDELRHQVWALSPQAKAALTAYARGVNDFIALGRLPPGYMEHGFEPEPWTVLDSAAILVRLLQYFGRGGAGELRNLAVLTYLRSQPRVKDHALEVFDDLAWFNDEAAPTTITARESKGLRVPFTRPTRAETERHLSRIPKLSLIELLPGIKLAAKDDSTRLAARLGTPMKTGSYCVVVGKSRSKTGSPWLMSAPQMGFGSPSPVHELSLWTPHLKVSGMDVPGVPAILVGTTPDLTWGITSGVADTEDIVFYPPTPGGYVYDGRDVPYREVRRQIQVEDGDPIEVVQRRTADGPVVLSTHGAIFAQRSAFRGRELQSYDAIVRLWDAKTAPEVDHAFATGTMSFNGFYALRNGNIGFRYAGRVPVRAAGIDPRLPTPGGSAYAWKGVLPATAMPHVLTPAKGMITNWNTKPAPTWPNGDTPVWGAIDHVLEIRRELNLPKIGFGDFMRTAEAIAKHDETWPFFRPYVQDSSGSCPAIDGYDGTLIDGSTKASLYRAWINELRRELLVPTTGGFLTDEYLEAIGQPSLLLRALEGKTNADYLFGRSATSLVRSALEKVCQNPPPPYQTGTIPAGEEPAVPYRNRGTFTQVVEMTPTGPQIRTVLPNGEAEAGPHAADQAELARNWRLKRIALPTD